MPAMTSAEYKSFIWHGTRTAKLATVRADGRPHIVPIWFALDGDAIVFTTGGNSLTLHGGSSPMGSQATHRPTAHVRA
jgi:nitroimidazol reductase NimA-like FMN-containing flavoprotein (pyridoxamine 5'-phosphate oxidase superfamily)